MSKRIFLFPGQGTQYIGMGKDFYDNFKESREIFNKVSDILKIRMDQLCFSETKEKLNAIKNTQIAILTVSLAILEVLKKYNINAKWTAGLSLGEYTSLIYSGILDLNTGIELVNKRGMIMQNNLPDMRFSMAAVITDNIGKIENICAKQQKNGKNIFISNYNSSKQVVLSGEENSVNEVINELKEVGIKKVIKLNTMGPFHTELMKKSKEKFKEELQKIKFNKSKMSVLKNIDATLYNEDDNYVNILSNHLTNPVQFYNEIKVMKEQNIEEYIEIGPGEVLTGFIKKEIPEAKTYSINSIEKLNEFLGEIKNG